MVTHSSRKDCLLKASKTLCVCVCVCSCLCVFFFGPLSAGFSSVCHLQELESKVSSNTVEQKKDFYEECERNGDQLNECEWLRELSYELLRGSLLQLIDWRRNRHLAVAQMPVLKPLEVHLRDFVGSGFIFLIKPLTCDWDIGKIAAEYICLTWFKIWMPNILPGTGRGI